VSWWDVVPNGPEEDEDYQICKGAPKRSAMCGQKHKIYALYQLYLMEFKGIHKSKIEEVVV